MKKIKVISIIAMFAIIAIDFIPIKFAVQYSGNLSMQDDTYICSHEQVTGGNWKVENHKSKQLYFDKFIGNSPFNCLTNEFSTDHIEPSRNMYLLQGDIIEKENEIYDLNIYKWDIVYPINRKSIRALYVPRSYLTAYDYDWIKLIRRLIMRES